jgi:hypothetical protein
MKSFGPKKFQITWGIHYMQGLKSAILAIFQTGLGWPCSGPHESLTGFQKLFLDWVPMYS